MDFVLGCLSSVGWESVVSLHGATKENAKVLVQVGQEEAAHVSIMMRVKWEERILLVGHGVVGCHVHHERSSSTAIEEVDRDTH